MSALCHGEAVREHFQTADTEAFGLQPGGIVQRTGSLSGPQILRACQLLKKTGRGILRTAGRRRAVPPDRFFGYLRNTTLPPCQTRSGSFFPPAGRSRSVPHKQRLQRGSVPPGTRPCRRTYPNIESFSLSRSVSPVDSFCFAGFPPAPQHLTGGNPSHIHSASPLQNTSFRISMKKPRLTAGLPAYA